MHHQAEIDVQLVGPQLEEEGVVALQVELEEAVDRLGVLQHLVVRLEGTLVFVLILGLLGRGRLAALGRRRRALGWVDLDASAQEEQGRCRAHQRRTESMHELCSFVFGVGWPIR